MKAAVLGLGDSVLKFKRTNENLVIGVNDILKYFNHFDDVVDRVLTVDTPKAFTKDRLKHFKKAHIISQYSEWIGYGMGYEALSIVPFSFKDMDEGKICFSNNSPFVAICYAYQKGAKIIDVYGVDVVGHKHLGNGGNYYKLLDDYRYLLQYLDIKEIEVNLHCKLKQLLNE
jgi:hypothetical protein